jgi:hypothetical protein
VKTVSNTDFKAVLRLLDALSRTKGETVREKENARKAWLLAKKLRKKDEGRVH